MTNPASRPPTGRATAPAPGTVIDRAVVLGPGAVVGTAWMLGLAAGLRREGVDLALADLLVGTSAGAIVGALLATGRDLDELALLPTPTPTPASALASPPAPAPAPASAPDLAQAAGPVPARAAESGLVPGGAVAEVDSDRLAEVFAVLGDPGLEPSAARRAVGRIALDAKTGPEGAHVARMSALIGTDDWPDRELLITTVDVETGEPVIWDRTTDAPLPRAVASSCAMPGVYPPITINGRRFMDGALRSGSNVDLAAGVRVLVVVEPLAHLFAASTSLPDGAVRIVADPASVEAFGPDLHARSSWEPAYRAGTRQGADAAPLIKAIWNG